MKCAICRTGELPDGLATVVLEREPTTVIIRGVPALVCDNCAEHYLDSATTRTTETLAAGAVKDGREVALLHFVAA